MFDIGFTEILVIAVVALFVIGPEKLPQTVKDISLWIGRLKRSLRDTRQELEQQIGADEIRRTLHNENVMQKLHHIKKDVEDTLNKDLMAEEEEDYELPPHDPNNDIDEEDETSENKAVKTTPAPPSVTAEALMTGDMPYATAAENASKSPREVEDQLTADPESAEANEAASITDNDNTVQQAESSDDETDSSDPVNTAEHESADTESSNSKTDTSLSSEDNSISGKSSSNHANSQYSASN